MSGGETTAAAETAAGQDNAGAETEVRQKVSTNGADSNQVSTNNEPEKKDAPRDGKVGKPENTDQIILGKAEYEAMKRNSEAFRDLGDTQALKRDADAFRASRSDTEKLKAAYAKLEFIGDIPNKQFAKALVKFLPETADKKQLEETSKAFGDALVALIGDYVKSGRLAYVNIGGSAGGNAPGPMPNLSRPAGELMRMRRG